MIKHVMFVVCALAITVARDAGAGPRKLVVVVAKGSPTTSVSRAQLKRCFLGEQVASAGKVLVPFNAAPNTSERTAFDDGALGMSPAASGRFWVDRKVRGQSGAPRSLPSVTHIVKVVAKFPNAIGYVPADQLTPELQPVAVDDIAYTDPRYPLELR